MSQSLIPPIAAISFNMKGAVAASGISKSSLYEDIAAGLLKTRKRGSATVIEADELRRYVASLPQGGRS